MKLSFCESVTATSISPWCIRELGDKGPMYGGGVDTPSFCGRVKPVEMKGFGGWDLHPEVTEATLSGKHVCPRCLEEYRKKTHELAP